MNGIVCFGDSITFGKGEKPTKGWVGRLKDSFEPKGSHNGVYNLGIPGQTSTELLKRIDIEAKARIRKKRPTDTYFIIIAIGTNDCKWDGMPTDNNPRTTDEQFKHNIRELITKAKAYDTQFAFIGLCPVDESRTLPYEETSFQNERVKQFNDIVKQACHEQEVPFIDMFEEISKEDIPKLLADGVHPNAEGYNFMFEKIKTFIEENYRP